MRVTRCGPELGDLSQKRPPPWLPPAEVRVPYVISEAEEVVDSTSLPSAS